MSETQAQSSLRKSEFFNTNTFNRYVWLAEIVLLIIAFAFGIFGLDRSPTVWYDETFYNEPAYQLAYHGKLISTLEPSVASREQIFLFPPIYAVFQAAVFRVFGLGIWQVRLTGLFFYLLTGLIIFLAGKSYFQNSLAGLVPSFIFLFDPAVVKSWRSGRPDAIAVFLGVLALYILLRSLRPGAERSRSTFLLCGIAGLIVGLACATHPNCMSFAVAGVIFLLFSMATWKERIAAIAIYVAGGILGIAPWIILIIKYPEAFYEQYMLLGARNSGYTDFLKGLSNQVKQLISYYRLSPLLLITQFAGLIWGLKSAKFRMFSLTGCWALLLYFIVIQNSHPLPYIVPIMALGTAGLTMSYVSRLSVIRGKFRAVTVLLVLLLLMSGLSTLGLRAFATIWQWEGRSHSALVSEWEKKISHGAKVAAPPECWYAALANGNTYRYHKIIETIGTDRTNEFRARLIEDSVEYLVLPAGADIHDYLLNEHVHLFQPVGSIRRPMRHLVGITVGEYNFDIYQRKIVEDWSVHIQYTDLQYLQEMQDA